MLATGLGVGFPWFMFQYPFCEEIVSMKNYTATVAATTILLGLTLFVSGCQSESSSDKMSSSSDAKMSDDKMGMDKMADDKMGMEKMSDGKMTDGKMSDDKMDKK
ncbi:MAG: hypothetical protein DWH81_11840 [Planctomycetota bacterium]|nr:MAG: hypothetical protein DWH81_11840 [Planctomycetota bacterium]